MVLQIRLVKTMADYRGRRDSFNALMRGLDQEQLYSEGARRLITLARSWCSELMQARGSIRDQPFGHGASTLDNGPCSIVLATLNTRMIGNIKTRTRVWISGPLERSGNYRESFDDQL
jgi:hypothetical protein